MPEFTVKEVRLPELHLPEIKRDEIVRSLSGVRLPEVDLARARQFSGKVPPVRLSASDAGRLLAAAATVARLVRPAPSRTAWIAPFARRSTSPLTRIMPPRRRRSRRPLAIGAIVLVVVGAWVVLRRPAVRRRVDAAARDARARLDGLRGVGASGDIVASNAITVPEPETVPADATDALHPAPPAVEAPAGSS